MHNAPEITKARSDGKCTICRKGFSAGDEIAWIKPAQLAMLNALGMSLKVFRRAHVACLPIRLPDEEIYRVAITEATTHLMDQTDPSWPKDCVGFNRPDAGFAKRFLDCDCPSEGILEMAKRLVKYKGTQLGADDSMMILEAVAQGERTRKSLLARLRRQRKAVTEITCGASIRDAATMEGPCQRGTVGISLSDWGVLVQMDHPNDNAAHAEIKDKLRAAGAKWDSVSYGWTISRESLAMVWGDVFTEAKMAITEDARIRLIATTELLESGALVVRRPGQVLVTAISRTALKVETDPPWINDAHAALKGRLKGLGASWDKAAGAWCIGAAQVAANYDYLWGLGSNLDLDSVIVTEDAQRQLEEAIDREALSNAASLEDSGVKTDVVELLAGKIPEGLTPYPYQLAGAAFIDAAGGRALIGDQMGLGKTIQSLLWLIMHPEARPAVLVVPSVVSTNWADETAKWAPAERVQRIKTGKQKMDPEATVCIITYDLARRRVNELRELAPQVILFDECHYLKNYKAKRTIAMLKLVEDVNPAAVIGLSGTPILNRPVEFYTMLKMLRPADYRSWIRYVKEYCGAHKDRYGWQIGGASNTQELAERLRDTMVRRTKAQVLKELPAKTRTDTKVDVPRKELKLIRDTVKAMVDSKEPGAHLAAMTWERHQTGLLKAQAAIQWIAEYADQGEPLLVFAHHQDVLNALSAGCEKLKLRTGRIDLNVSADKRGALVKSFQAGDLDVMLLGIESGGVGITLTAASNVMFVERAWTPSAEEQAEDRVHRIGQENPVNIRYLVAEGTIDSYITGLIDSKREVVQSILDGEAPSRESLNIRSEFLSAWMAHHGLTEAPKAPQKMKAKAKRTARTERAATQNKATGGGSSPRRPSQQEMRW